MATLRTMAALLVFAISTTPVIAQPEPLLPKGARFRLGSAGITASGRQATISSDGKYIAADSLDGTVVFDRATGQALTKFRQVQVENAAFVPRHKALAYLRGFELVVAELPSGKTLHKFQIDGPSGHRQVLSFSADGNRVAMAMGLRIHEPLQVRVWDVGRGKAVGTFAVLQNRICSAALSPDGKMLATRGSYMPTGEAADKLQPNRVVQLWDVDTRKELRRLPCDAGTGPAAFSRDGKRLAVASYRGIRIFDIQSGQEVDRLDPEGDHYYAGVEFSPDGRLLIAGSQSVGVLVWDIAARKRIKLGPGPIPLSGALAFPGNGQIIALHVDDQTLVSWDILAGRYGKIAPGHCTPVLGLGYSSDGTVLRSMSCDGMVLGWDPTTGKPPREREWIDKETAPLRGPRYRGLALSPDGRFAAGNDRFGACLWHLASGRWRDLQSMDVHEHGNQFAFAPDGSRLAVASEDTWVNLWDTAGRRQSMSIDYGIPNGGHLFTPPLLSWSLNSKRLAVTGLYVPPGGDSDKARTRVLLIDAVRGKRIHVVELPNGDAKAPILCAVSPDGECVVLPDTQHHLVVVRAPTGTLLRRLALGAGADAISTLLFAPDGRTVAVALGGNYLKDEEGTTLLAPTATRVQLWELASGQMRVEFIGHVGPVNCLAFAPDSRTLASGSTDTTVMLWDATGTHGRKPLALTAEELAAAWDALARPNAQAAFAAMGRLGASPAPATAFLRSRLPPAKMEVFDAARLKELMANLDHDRFEQRDAAFRTLVNLGTFAEPALRKARAGMTSLEMRRRIDLLLERIERHDLTVEQLQVTRAIEVLERIATPAARELLESLARGTPEALQSREAQAALGRMNR